MIFSTVDYSAGNDVFIQYGFATIDRVDFIGILALIILIGIFFSNGMGGGGSSED